jgi:hypothetical protein
MSTGYVPLQNAPDSKPEPLLIPEPPQADADTGVAPITVHRLDFVKLGLPEYRHKYVQLSVWHLSRSNYVAGLRWSLIICSLLKTAPDTSNMRRLQVSGKQLL